MIQYFSTRDHNPLARDFLDSWSPADNAWLHAVSYENFPFRKPLPNGVCIFADLERLLPGERLLATQLAAALRGFPENYTVLNDPRRYLGRFNLQKILHQQGINEFRVWRLDEPLENLKFPVFLRDELNHDGPLTPLLHSRDELSRVLAQSDHQNPARRKHLMLVEYCDCADAGGDFRKYSAMKIGDVLIPRHVLFSRNWATKTPDLVSEKTVAAEIEFTENFPHAAEIEKIFQIAGLDYGRIDYGLHHGRIQVWEINSHPTIVPRREKIDPRRLRVQSRSAEKIIAALRRFSTVHPAGAATPFRSPKFFAHKTALFFKNRRQHPRR